MLKVRLSDLLAVEHISFGTKEQRTKEYLLRKNEVQKACNIYDWTLDTNSF
jgi:hypothetical protein